MSTLSKRLAKIEHVLTPPEPEKIDTRWHFVRGGHGKPIMRTVKGYASDALPADGELDDPATEWEVIRPADPTWPKAEGIDR